MPYRSRLAALALALLAAACAETPPGNAGAGGSFTIAVIPDTQNYIDYRRQQAEGFALDSKDLFIAQMMDIASRDDVVFVAAVGDVWQHGSIDVDPAHEARGKGAMSNPLLDEGLKPTSRTLSEEIPEIAFSYKPVKNTVRVPPAPIEGSNTIYLPPEEITGEFLGELKAIEQGVAAYIAGR